MRATLFRATPITVIEIAIQRAVNPKARLKLIISVCIGIYVYRIRTLAARAALIRRRHANPYAYVTRDVAKCILYMYIPLCGKRARVFAQVIHASARKFREQAGDEVPGR